MYCPNCGQKQNDESKFCNKCGYALDTPDLHSQETSSINLNKNLYTDTNSDSTDEKYSSSKSDISNSITTHEYSNENTIRDENSDLKSKSTSFIKSHKIISFIVFGLLILFIIGSLSNGIDLNGDVEVIKSSYFNSYPEEDGYNNIGDSFDNYFKNAKWSSFTSEDDERIVEFNGDFLYLDEETHCTLQFKIDDSGSFDIQAVEFNDVPQSKLMIIGLVSDIMDGNYK